MRGLLVRLRALIRPRAEYAEMDEELRYHVDQQARQFAARGLNPEEARVAALRALGNMEQHKDAMLDTRGISFLEHARRDLSHAWRSLARMPLTAAVVVLSLAIGIGVNTTIFTWIQLVLLDPLPGVRNAATLQLIEPTTPHGGFPGMSWLEYRDLRDRSAAFSDVVAASMVPLSVGVPPRNEREFGQMVSANYFSALGVRAALGRLIDAGDVDAPGGQPVVVLSAEYWRSKMAADSQVIGRSIDVNGRALTIIGVTAPGFQGSVLGLEFALWVPATLAPQVFPGSRQLEERSERGYHVVGRLRPGQSREAAVREVEALYRELATLYPGTNARIVAEVRPFWKAPVGPQQMLATGLVVLQAIMLVLLLVVCGNTVNLMLARASARRREMGARLALGASRWRIMSLVLWENMSLAAAAGALGVLLAVWGTNALRAAPFIGSFPIRFQTQVDGLTVAFAVVLAFACCLAIGLAPALDLARTEPQLALRSGYGSAPRGRMRGVLIGGEVAMALVVLVAAALFYRSFRESRSDSGFRQSGILLAGYDRGATRPSNAETIAFTDRLLRGIAAIPGVAGVAISGSVPLDIHGLPLRTFTLEGRPSDETKPDRALTNVVTPGYFAVMDIPLVSGSDLAPLTDVLAGPQVVVNEEFARRFVQGGEPLGRRLTSGGTSYTIVGVVRNSFYDAFGEPPRPAIYFSYRDRAWWSGQLHVRTREGGEAGLAGAVQQTVRAIDPALPIFDVRTMSEHVDKNLYLRKIPARMFAVLGPLLLILAAIGIYAVVDYAVALRTHEIGLRLALGASRRRVVLDVMRETLRSVGYGTLLGLVVALVIALHVARGVISLPVFVGMPLLLLAVSAAACWLPARRAAVVDPMVSLRRE